MASNRFDIRLLGSEQLSRDLAALPEKLERKVLTKALRQAGKYYMNLAKARVPRDEGRWASTLKVRALKRKKGRIGVAIRVGSRSELGIDPKQRGFYPAHQEFGHRDRAGVHHPPLAPMRISLKTGESAILGIVRQELEAGIAAAMRGPA